MKIAVRRQNLIAIFLEKLAANAALVLLIIALCVQRNLQLYKYN